MQPESGAVNVNHFVTTVLSGVTSLYGEKGRTFWTFRTFGSFCCDFLVICRDICRDFLVSSLSLSFHLLKHNCAGTKMGLKKVTKGGYWGCVTIKGRFAGAESGIKGGLIRRFLVWKKRFECDLGRIWEEKNFRMKRQWKLILNIPVK